MIKKKNLKMINMFWHDLKLWSFFKIKCKNLAQNLTLKKIHIYSKMINKEHVIYKGKYNKLNKIKKYFVKKFLYVKKSFLAKGL